MKCPRDRSVLVFTDQGSHPRNKCPKCSGLLVSKEEVLAILEGKAPEPARLAALPESGLACPRDGANLRRIDHQGVEVDVCLECYSVWLDSGELEKIVALRKKGKKTAGRAAVAAAAVAGVAGAAALTASAQPAQAQSFAGSLAEGVGDVVVEGGLNLAFEFLGEILGGLLS